jgi:hypothetical protein
MFELDIEARYRNESLPRYARWSVLDRERAEGPSFCWLDRRTGRLVYQPDQADPNASGVIASSPAIVSAPPSEQKNSGR